TRRTHRPQGLRTQGRRRRHRGPRDHRGALMTAVMTAVITGVAVGAAPNGGRGAAPTTAPTPTHSATCANAAARRPWARGAAPATTPRNSPQRPPVVTVLAAPTLADRALVWALLLAVVLVWIGVYALGCTIWPFKACRRCNGTGKRRSPSGKAFKLCRRCRGTGRRLRIGRRAYNA